MVEAAMAELATVPTDLLREMLAAETSPALAWLEQVELNRRIKQQRPWWENVDGFDDPKDN